MNWPLYKLDELGSVNRGRSRHRPRNAPHLYGGKYPFIQTSDVKASNLYITEYSQTYNDAGLAQSKLWLPGTLCITIAANIAETGILGISACFPDSIIGFIPYEGKSDVRYIKYYFDIFQKTFQQISQGATQDNLSAEKLVSLKIPLPPLPLQQKIAGILAAYDDLIENNCRRIKLLEEMAQITYEEWFVRFRFPGFETLAINPDTGLPKGWEIKKVGSLIGKAPKSAKIKSSEFQNSGSIPVVDQSRDFVAGYTDDPESLINVNHPVIIFGDHTRVLKFINFPFARGADGTQVIISNENRMPQHLFYHALLNLDLSNYHYARHYKFLKELEIVVPDLSMASEYEQITKGQFEAVRNLRKQNARLREARDILLPRLMTGIIDVEEYTPTKS